MSQQQPIKILKIFKDFFACKIVLAASQRYPGNIQRFFRLQNCRSRKSAISWKQSNILPPAKLSQQQPIIILKSFKDFFACKNVLAKNHLYPGFFQRFFRLQNCLSRKSAISWKHSKIFPPAKLSQQQPIIILKSFKKFFACKIVLALNYRSPGKIQRLFRLQNCLNSNPSKLSKYSKSLSPAKLSLPQISDILETLKDFSACKIVVAANQRYPGNNQTFFRLQNCLSRKSSISWKYSKSFSPAKLSQQQPINILKMFKNFLACKIVLAANHLYPGNIQRLYRLRKCLSSNPSKFSKYSKTFSAAKLSQQQPIIILKSFKDFFACKNVLAKNHLYPGIFQRLFRLQNCLSRKSSISWKLSKKFLPAKLSKQQPINILKIFKDFFARKIVLAANQRYPANIQRFFRLQKCVNSNPSKFSKYSKTLSPAELSQPQVIDILEIFKDFFACKNFLAATHHYSEKIQRLFRLQNCRSRKSAIS